MCLYICHVCGQESEPPKSVRISFRCLWQVDLIGQEVNQVDNDGHISIPLFPCPVLLCLSLFYYRISVTDNG